MIYLPVCSPGGCFAGLVGHFKRLGDKIVAASKPSNAFWIMQYHVEFYLIALRQRPRDWQINLQAEK